MAAAAVKVRMVRMVVTPGSKALDKSGAAVVEAVAVTILVRVFLVETILVLAAVAAALTTMVLTGEMVALVLVVTLAEVAKQQSLTTPLDNLELAVAAVLVLVVTTTIWAAVEALASMVRVQTVLVETLLVTEDRDNLDKVDLVDNLDNRDLVAVTLAVSTAVQVVEPSVVTTKAAEVLTVL